MKHYPTGLPRDFKVPRYVVSNWPRLVQLSWIVTDENGNKLKSGDHIIRHDDGHKFYLSNNGVWLTDFVAPNYLIIP